MANRIFSFPNPVNEVSARIVAGGVVLMSLATIVFDQPWLTAVIAYGFVARVLSGPDAQPARPTGDASHHSTPAVPGRSWCPGPPKRFAQGIGARPVGDRGAPGARVRRDHRRVRSDGPARRGRDAGVGVRALPRLQDLRGADADRRRARRDLRGVQQHLGASAPGASDSTETLCRIALRRAGDQVADLSRTGRPRPPVRRRPALRDGRTSRSRHSARIATM